jgi:hypothetical protein
MMRRVLANGPNTFGMTMHPDLRGAKESARHYVARETRPDASRRAVEMVGTIVEQRWPDGYGCQG